MSNLLRARMLRPLLLAGMLGASHAIAISAIQTVTDVSGSICGDSPYHGQLVTVECAISAVKYNGFFCQDAPAVWSGLWVYADHSANAYWGDDITYTVGELVRVTGVIDEYYDLTEIDVSDDVDNFAITRIGYDYDMIAPISVTTGTLGIECNLAGEAYEGLMVTLANVELKSTPTEFGEIEIDDGSGPTQLEDGLMNTHEHFTTAFCNLTDRAYVGDVMTTLTGIVRYAWSSYEVGRLVRLSLSLSLSPSYALSVVPCGRARAPRCTRAARTTSSSLSTARARRPRRRPRFRTP